MQLRSFREDEVPYFCWDRKLTAGDIRAQLRHAAGPDWIRLASWILREAAGHVLSQTGCSGVTRPTRVEIWRSARV